MRILTFSTLYPNAARPGHGIFVETRLRHLLASGKVESKVVAPVPWFPSRNPRFGEYAASARTPQEESRHGIDFGTYFSAEIPRLVPLVVDGLVELSPTSIQATSRGRLLLRIIAACFDRYLHEAPGEPVRYSKAI